MDSSCKYCGIRYKCHNSHELAERCCSECRKPFTSMFDPSLKLYTYFCDRCHSAFLKHIKIKVNYCQECNPSNDKIKYKLKISPSAIINYNNENWIPEERKTKCDFCDNLLWVSYHNCDKINLCLSCLVSTEVKKINDSKEPYLIIRKKRSLTRDFRRKRDLYLNSMSFIPKLKLNVRTHPK